VGHPVVELAADSQALGGLGLGGSLKGAKPEAFLLGLPAAGDIGEEDGDLPLIRGADAEGVDIVEAVVQVPRRVLEPLWLAR